MANKEVKTQVEEIIETVKNNEEVFSPIIKSVEDKFEEGYRKYINEMKDAIMYWHEDDREVDIDYESICKEFVDKLEEVCDIDIEEFIRTEEFEEAEEYGWLDNNGCIDDKYQFGLYILSYVSDYNRFQDIFYDGDLTFDMDEDDYDMLLETKEKFEEEYDKEIREIEEKNQEYYR